MDLSLKIFKQKVICANSLLLVLVRKYERQIGTEEGSAQLSSIVYRKYKGANSSWIGKQVICFLFTYSSSKTILSLKKIMASG